MHSSKIADALTEIMTELDAKVPDVSEVNLVVDEKYSKTSAKGIINTPNTNKAYHLSLKLHSMS